MSRHCVCIVGSSSQLQVKHVDELTRATWQHSKLSPPLKPLLSILLSAYYPSLCFLRPELCENPAQGMLQKIPLFLLRAVGLVVNFSSWLTWEGLRLAGILRRAPCATQVLSGWSEREIDFSDLPKAWIVLSARGSVRGYFGRFVSVKGSPREIVYQWTIVAAV